MKIISKIAFLIIATVSAQSIANPSFMSCIYNHKTGTWLTAGGSYGDRKINSPNTSVDYGGYYTLGLSPNYEICGQYTEGSNPDSVWAEVKTFSYIGGFFKSCPQANVESGDTLLTHISKMLAKGDHISAVLWIPGQTEQIGYALYLPTDSEALVLANADEASSNLFNQICDGIHP